MQATTSAQIARQSSFIASIASIQKDSSRNIPRPRRSSSFMDEGRGGKPESQNRPPRRRTTSNCSFLAASHADPSYCFTPPCQKETIEGILRSPDDTPVTTTTHNRVSFAHHRDGSIVASPGECPTSNRLSSRASMQSIPPPPPRAPALSSRNKNLSDSFHKAKMIKLPFPAAPAPPRRHSMIGMEKVEEERGPSAPPPAMHRRRSDGDNAGNDNSHHRNKHQVYSGPRKIYTLGDVARSPSHMVTEHDPQVALERVSDLKNYDFAFIKRSDGSWSYAILAYRCDESMTFVMSEKGSTKVLKQKQWAEYVRCVAAGTDESPDEFVPKTVYVDDHGEDCSMVTFLY